MSIQIVSWLEMNSSNTCLMCLIHLSTAVSYCKIFSLRLRHWKKTQNTQKTPKLEKKLPQKPTNQQQNQKNPHPKKTPKTNNQEKIKPIKPLKFKKKPHQIYKTFLIFQIKSCCIKSIIAAIFTLPSFTVYFNKFLRPIRTLSESKCLLEKQSMN